MSESLLRTLPFTFLIVLFSFMHILIRRTCQMNPSKIIHKRHFNYE